MPGVRQTMLARGDAVRLVGRRAVSGLLDLLFPPRCVGCGREGPYICAHCLDAVPHLDAPVGVNLDALEGIVAPFGMEGVGREAVHRLKYAHLRAVASPMAELLARHLTGRGLTGDLLVPVPLHPRRLRQRGYNQAELLARHVGRVLEIPVECRGLRRRTHGPPQARSAGREERRSNVAGAFEARRSFDGLDVLVLDDVATTGATLEACAAALKAAGASSVWGVAFAHEL